MTIEQTSSANIDRAVMAFAGIVNLIGVLLAWRISPSWLLLPTFVGLNLLQASFTGFCPSAIVFRRLGLKPGSVFK